MHPPGAGGGQNRAKRILNTGLSFIKWSETKVDNISVNTLIYSACTFLENQLLHIYVSGALSHHSKVCNEKFLTFNRTM